jgi:hypothetical protein
MYLGRSWSIFVIEIIFGFALLWNCLAALLRREDMYNQESAKIMHWSLFAGMLFGAALVVHGLCMVRLLFQVWQR